VHVEGESGPGRAVEWVAVIRDADGRSLGCGVLVAPGYVLTCAQVLRPGGGSPDGERFTVELGAPGDRQLANARVARGGWVPPRRGGGGGVALLELSGPQLALETPDLAITSPRVGQQAAVCLTNEPDGEFRWQSARVDEDEGERGFGLFLDAPGASWRPAPGAPVFGHTSRDFVGLVVETRPDTSATVLPVDTIVSSLPKVARWFMGPSAPLAAPVALAGSGLSGTREETLGTLTPPDDDSLTQATQQLLLPTVLLPLGYENPTRRLLADPEVPEDRRFCPRCREPVGRGRPGGGSAAASARTEGYCPNCGFRYSFRPKLRPGDVVADRYEVLGCLARGGLGWIHLAVDRHRDGEHVVLKGLLNSADETAMAAAATEHRYLAMLDHPGIVRTHDFVSHAAQDARDVTDYIVMEYVGGLSLRELKGDRLLPIEQVAALGLRILDVLAYLHGRGLLYCDMKPDNVILGPDGVKVIDLGAVRRMDDHESPAIGTPRYRCPRAELDAHGLTVRSDLYSVGRTLEELFDATGSLWRSRHQVGVESLHRVVARATAEYEQRFSSAEEMSHHLAGALREFLRLLDGRELPASASRMFAAATAPADGGLAQVPPLSYWTGERERRSGTELGGSPDPRLLAESLPQSVWRDFRGHDTVAVTYAVNWRDHWETGRLRLREGNAGTATAHFAQVQAALPGEIAPKLAVAHCAELLGDRNKAERYYAAVWLLDRTQAGAAFGLARLRLARGDRAGAVEVMDQVASHSRHSTAAATYAVLILCAFLPVGDRHGAEPPAPSDVAEAARRLAALRPRLAGPEEEARLTALVWEAACSALAALPAHETIDARPLADRPVTEPEARRLLAGALRAIVRESRSAGGHKALLDHARGLLARRGPRSRDVPREAGRESAGARTADPSPGHRDELAVTQSKFLTPDDRKIHAVLDIAPRDSRQPTGEVPTRDLTLRITTTTPQTRLRHLHQVSPTVADLTGDGLPAPGDGTVEFRLGALGDDETRQYHLCLTVDPAWIPHGEDLQAAVLELVAPSGSVAADGTLVPVVVHVLDQLARADRPIRQELQQAADALGAARARSDWAEAERAYERIASLADELGDETILSLARALEWATRPDAPRGDPAPHLFQLAADLPTDSEALQLSARNRYPRGHAHESEYSQVSAYRYHSHHSRARARRQESVYSSVAYSRHSVVDPAHPGRHRAPGHGPAHRRWHRERRVFEPALPDRVCPVCSETAPAADLFCTVCGHEFHEPAPAARREPEPAPAPHQAPEPPPALPAVRRARVWCPTDDPVVPGRPTRVAFAFAAPGGPPGEEPEPLPEAVKLRVLLESPDATVRPVTQVVLLDVDRTSDPVEFEVVPVRGGELGLHFRVYLDLDSQLLQEVRAQLPVSEPAEGREKPGAAGGPQRDVGR
jgi:serine/threonine-protein kinase PknG